mmetsp:Transcript_16221/g.48254  ORF Transcript_16221/g.48254 Transcript_16221/m.48254 type:complete len:224 (+) Transcript_16221:2001-2672(+)
MRGHVTAMMSSALTPEAKVHLEPRIAATSNTSAVIPIFWQADDAQAGPKDVQGFKSRVYYVLWYKRILGLYLPTVGAALAALSLLQLVRLRSLHGADHADNDNESSDGWAGGGTSQSTHSSWLPWLAPSMLMGQGRNGMGAAGMAANGDATAPLLGGAPAGQASDWPQQLQSSPSARIIEDTGSGMSSIAVNSDVVEERYRSPARSLVPPASLAAQLQPVDVL